MTLAHTIAPCDLRSMEDAHDLFAVGAGHAISARLLADAAGENAFNGATSVSILLLIGFSIELMLKAVLIQRGVPESVRRLEVGHDLLKAQEKARAVGFDVPAESGAGVLIALMQDVHVANFFRYLGSELERALPEPRDVFPVIEELMLTIGNDIGFWPTSPN